ncbi:MAG: aminotransferase class III-fold pyridoxal phosphate-dependent enzyme, partial [Gemmatimonadota bacterium]|nr:aminotransferase class III-fold pyridoxal phosphate-dependent enzyme [Gemmatimonadota bacterium]
MTEQGRRLAERKAERILPCVKHYYEDPMVVAEGKMQHLRDEEGREYLDFFAGILTVQVGHCNEAVNKAVVDQVGRLQHTSTVYLTEPVLDLADKMAEITPDGLEKSFFANSGTEANDTALLLAKLATGKDDIVALRHAYHGRSQVAIGVTGLSSWRLPTSAPHNTLFAQNAYCYRCPLGREYPSCEVRCARDLEDVIDTQTHGSVAALIAEP